MRQKISTEPYKGVRDFYPEEMSVENYLFSKMRQTVESFGYVEYNASILESAELYEAKTGEEIVNEQTYTFTDRGDRRVTLRPEMTPTVARMIAKKRTEFYMPLRLYSIPNLFRYEKMQKGRLREHYQLNVDIFGIDSSEADAEIISVAYKLMINLGAKNEDFEIRINDRRIMNLLYEKFGLNEEESYKISKIIDKKDKISSESYKSALEVILKEKTDKFIETLESNQNLIKILGEKSLEIEGLIKLIEDLDALGIKNVRFDQTLMRGFDYYTGFVFEIYDTNSENKRSLFGGGRYDNLLEIFGKEKMPAVGFGAGDVTILDFLEVRNLIPEYKNPVSIYICSLGDEFSMESKRLADNLRQSGINVAEDLTLRKVADRIKSAVKQKIPFIVFIGENEVKSKKYKLKNLNTEEEKELTENEIASFIKHE